LGQAATSEEEVNDQAFDLSFSVHKSRRYHEKLCGFYSWWRDSMKLVTAVSGSGVFVLLFASWTTLGTALSAFVALWAILDIVIGPDKKAELHKDFCQRFTELAAQMEGVEPALESLRRWRAARLDIEKDEPPCRRLVDLAARNDEWRARGFPPENLVPLSGPQRFFGYVFTFGMRRLEDWKAERQRAEASV
jgi:hypothetical protein